MKVKVFTVTEVSDDDGTTPWRSCFTSKELAKKAVEEDAALIYSEDVNWTEYNNSDVADCGGTRWIVVEATVFDSLA